jgi:hypothetical protein
VRLFLPVDLGKLLEQEQGVHKFRLENERFLDQSYHDFKALVLDRIEQRPNVFMDAAFQVNVLGGRITLQQSETNEGGRRFVEKSKPQ